MTARLAFCLLAMVPLVMACPKLNVKCASDDDDDDNHAGCTSIIAAKALAYPISFAQVREDPWIEKQVLSALVSSADEGVSMLMVGSGGDTTAFLAAEGEKLNIKRIVVVDPNAAQLSLVQLKMHLLKQPSEERLRLLGHSDMDRHERASRLRAIMSNDDKAFFWEHTPPDYAGRYESLFESLREHLEPVKQQIEELCALCSVPEQQLRLQTGTALNLALNRSFEQVFSQANLVQVFGEKATGNRVQDFAPHFLQRLQLYLNMQPACESPYLAQLLLGRFHNSVHYPWLDVVAAPPPTSLPLVTYHPTTLQHYLSTHPDPSFDFVHMSNILDWLDPAEASAALQQVVLSLKPGGVVLLRQLNSNLDIPALSLAANMPIAWDIDQGNRLNKEDRSFFYTHLFVGARLNSSSTSTSVAQPRPQHPSTSCPVTRALVQSVVDEYAMVRDNAYLVRLRQGSMKLADFQQSQQDFHHAVDFFSRPMSVLMARLPDLAQRIELLENIVEEHGNFNGHHAHARTFRRFLSSIGVVVDDDDVASTTAKGQPAVTSTRRTRAPSVDAFNLALMGVAWSEDPIVALGCFGMIEFVFADISSLIGEAVVAHGWVKLEELVHYSLHAQLDKEHAESFFVIVEAEHASLADDAARKQLLFKFERGLRLGAYIFDRLYRDLILVR